MNKQSLTKEFDWLLKSAFQLTLFYYECSKPYSIYISSILLQITNFYSEINYLCSDSLINLLDLFFI